MWRKFIPKNRWLILGNNPSIVGNRWPRFRVRRRSAWLLTGALTATTSPGNINTSSSSAQHHPATSYTLRTAQLYYRLLRQPLMATTQLIASTSITAVLDTGGASRSQHLSHSSRRHHIWRREQYINYINHHNRCPANAITACPFVSKIADLCPALSAARSNTVLSDKSWPLQNWCWRHGLTGSMIHMRCLLWGPSQEPYTPQDTPSWPPPNHSLTLPAIFSFYHAEILVLFAGPSALLFQSPLPR